MNKMPMMSRKSALPDPRRASGEGGRRDAEIKGGGVAVG